MKNLILCSFFAALFLLVSCEKSIDSITISEEEKYKYNTSDDIVPSSDITIANEMAKSLPVLDLSIDPMVEGGVTEEMLRNGYFGENYVIAKLKKPIITEVQFQDAASNKIYWKKGVVKAGEEVIIVNDEELYLSRCGNGMQAVAKELYTSFAFI